MRSSGLILSMAMVATLGVVGCSQERTATSSRQPLQSYERPLPATASLAFTPPIARDDLEDMGLDRAGRGVYANGGYEAVVISETYTRQDDRYRFNRYGDQSQFERHSVSTTVTVRQH